MGMTPEYYQDNKDRLKAQQQEYYEKNAEIIKAKKRARYNSLSPEQKMFKSCKERAKREGREFSITLDDITIPERCPYLDIPLVTGKTRMGWDSPSLDRIDNTKGYIPGNVRVVSALANDKKGTMSEEALVAFAKRILELHD